MAPRPVTPADAGAADGAATEGGRGEVCGSGIGGGAAGSVGLASGEG